MSQDVYICYDANDQEFANKVCAIFGINISLVIISTSSYSG